MSDSQNGCGTGHCTMPFFKYIPPKPVRGDLGRIVVGAETFHRIGNPKEFYAALGFTPDLAKRNWLPEEFVWDRYSRQGASKSQHCLQAQIVAYLYGKSTEFRERYGHAHDQMIGKCNSDCMDDSDEHCFKCSMHPRAKN